MDVNDRLGRLQDKIADAEACVADRRVLREAARECKERADTEYARCCEEVAAAQERVRKLEKALVLAETGV